MGRSPFSGWKRGKLGWISCLGSFGLAQVVPSEGLSGAGFSIFGSTISGPVPPEKDADGSIDALGNEDQAAVLQLFQLASDAATELAPELQIIVMDHAELNTDWFREAVVERWRNGLNLIPQEWLA